jgi:predicted ATP-dependent serine protease
MSHAGAMACVPTLEGTELNKLVNDVYKWNHQGYSCNDNIMSEFCDPVCKYFKQKNYGTDIKTAKELSNAFMEFVQTDFTESSFNLKDIYNIPNDYIFMPGELCILIGDTKLGKTAWLQNVIAPLKSMRILFLSLEVNEWMIFRRFAQVANGMTKQEVMEIYRSRDEEKISQIISSIDHINCTTTAPNIESIKEIVSDQKPDIVVIDTVDVIDVPFQRDPLAKMDTVINSLKAIANEQNMIFFGISHISKSASNDVLNVHSAKGSSAIEQKADKIIGIIGDRDNSQRRVVRSLASRDEDGFEIACMFDYSIFKFKEIA